MKKRITTLIITMLLIFVLGVSGNSIRVGATEATKEMNIYGIYLETEDKGDSVLMESKGQYLLMDIGSYSNVDAIISQLRSLKVTEIEIYLSHLHLDHIGGASGDVMAGMNKLADSGISITRMYLPDPQLAPESVDYPRKYQRLETFMEDKGEIVYLKVGDTLQIGDVSGKVIGPLKTDRIHPSDYAGMESSGDSQDETLVMYTYYENNCSLATMFTCGNTKFFTAGDALMDEANFLVEAYGSQLKADIMKLSHHGTGSGNTESLLEAVSPSYTFASNTGLTEVNPTTKKWQTNMARKASIKTAMCYLIGNQEKTIIYQVKNDEIRQYTNKISSRNLMTGWVTLYGADGEFRKTDKYYLDENSVPLKGIQKIDGQYFYFGKGGCMEYGNYNENGVYQGWKSYDDGRRYFTYSEDKKCAYMTVGFKDIGSERYYFDNEGYKIEGKGETELVEIDNKKYGVGKSGAIVISNWATIGSAKYYFGKTGAMVANKKVKIGKNYYYFGEDGKMARASKGTSLVEIDNKKYGVGKSGAIVISNWATVGSAKYYFDETGVMVTNKKVKIGKNYYYFGEDGKMVRATKGTELITIGKKKYGVGKSGTIVISNWATIGSAKYYFGKTGSMVTDKKIKIGKNYYYFGEDGKMVRASKGTKLVTIDNKKYGVGKSGAIVISNWATVGSAKYYFDKSGTMVTNKKVKIGKNYYYFGKDGKMVRNRKVRIDKYSYYFGKSGVMYTSQSIKIGKVRYKCLSDGRMRVIK